MATYYVRRNDRRPALSLTISDAAGTSVNLTTATSVTLKVKAPGATTLKVDSAMSVVSAAAGTVTRSWASGDTDTAGVYDLEAEVLWNDGTKQSFPPIGKHRLIVEPDLG